MTARDIVAYLEQRSPTRGQEEGFKFGDPNAPVNGVLVCWMATLPALEHAVAQGCNLVICHETIFFPDSRAIEREMCWPCNRRKLEIMSSGRLVLFRAHGALDTLCIYEDFAAALGLSRVARGEGYYRIFTTQPLKVADLAARVKEAVGMSFVRMAGNPDRVVSKIGLPWGGLGLFVNIGFMQDMVEAGAEAVICGESDEYAMRFANDSGLELIETGHSVSEAFGLRHFAQDLQAAFPDVRIVYFDNGPGWATV